MNAQEATVQRHSVATPSGKVSDVEHGTGRVALFVQDVLMNGHLWRHQLAHVGHVRRCIAVDVLALGHTEIAPTQDLSGSQLKALQAPTDLIRGRTPVPSGGTLACVQRGAPPALSDR